MSPSPPHLAAALALIAALSLIVFPFPATAASPRLPPAKAAAAYGNLTFGASKKFEGSSDLVKLVYHMGPVLSSNITVHPIWYGAWAPSQKRIIRDFLLSLSAAPTRGVPSVANWWRTVALYTDQTGANISRTITLGSEKNDRNCSLGKSLTRLTVQRVIKRAVVARTRPLDIHPSGIYLLLTADDVLVQDFCAGACGFHYFTFPSIVGYTLPYAWVGNSAKMCPGACAYPFAVPSFMTGVKALVPPNGDVGVDGMISVIGHEIAELATNPLVNAWFAGTDPTAPVEIADLCEGIYGTGGGGAYIGQLLLDKGGASYNLHGLRRKYLVQWVWDNFRGYCYGPNALD